jgi:hypothetical protein
MISPARILVAAGVLGSVARPGTKPIDGYILTAGKRPQLKQSDGTEQSGCRPAIQRPPGQTMLVTCRNVTMQAFTEVRLTGGGLAWRSLSLIDATDLGFARDHLLLAAVGTAGAASDRRQTTLHPTGKWPCTPSCWRYCVQWPSPSPPRCAPGARNLYPRSNKASTASCRAVPSRPAS